MFILHHGPSRLKQKETSEYSQLQRYSYAGNFNGPRACACAFGTRTVPVEIRAMEQENERFTLGALRTWYGEAGRIHDGC